MKEGSRSVGEITSNYQLVLQYFRFVCTYLSRISLTTSLSVVCVSDTAGDLAQIRSDAELRVMGVGKVSLRQSYSVGGPSKAARVGRVVTIRH